jgi:NAD(P)-dependent dehydrogenase (short-subunit alcohol dehydrogenase family)
MSQKLDYNIMMTSRDRDNGIKAVETLLDLYPDYKDRIDFGSLDITDKGSVSKFRDTIVKKFAGSVDVVVNNAGVGLLKGFNIEVLENNFRTNFGGSAGFQGAMNDLMAQNGRVVYVGAAASLELFKKMDPSLKENFVRKNLTKNELLYWEQELYRSAKEKRTSKDGWPSAAYMLSKLFVMCWARAEAAEAVVAGKGVQVYSVCPGFCATDMTDWKPKKVSYQGASEIVWLFEKEAREEENGTFWFNKKVTQIG